MSCHILGNRRLTHINAEFEDFAMDPRSAPERVGEAHVADQLADFEWHFLVCRRESASSIARTGETRPNASG